MNQKIKQREERLKRKEEQLKKDLNKEGNQLKKQVNRVGKIALAAGIASFILYWIYKAFFAGEEEQEQTAPKTVQKSQTISFTQRIMNLLTPYITKLLSDFISSESQKEKEDID